MPVAKLSTSGSLSTMKSEEGNDSLDTFVRQAIGKEPLLPFSRTGDNPVQWIQLVQPDLLGWPLMTPIKVQMQKCEKCSREFCSPINYRRHSRVHRRSLNVDKESHKNRDLLAAFWDKLSLEEAKEVMSYNGVMLKEIPGSSVVRALASSLRKPEVLTLSQVYLRAGSSLLDIIQAKPSRLPISSQELFGILDDASERTFLCAGKPESVQNYLFDGEATKNSLDLRNLVASTSFLFEQQLVKAWVASKDAEALRWQKLLVEEEEAAKKRLVELLERKKQKKLRQKEHKVKEQFHGCKGDLDATDGPILAEESGLSSPSDSSSNSIDVPANLDSCLESLQFQNKKLEKDVEARNDFSSECVNQEDTQNIGTQMVGECGHQYLATNSRQVSNSQRGCQCGFNASENIHNLRPESIRKTCPSKDQALLDGIKVWTEEDKMESHRKCLKPSLQDGISHQMEKFNCEVIVGSISIPVNSCAAQHQHFYPGNAQDICSPQPAMLRNSSGKLIESDTVNLATNRGAKLWRPVSCGETKGNDETQGTFVSKKIGDRIMHSERCMPLQSTYNDCDEHNHVLSDESFQPGRIMPFTSIAAKEFLVQRWKEAISADHVKLVLS